MADKMTKQDYLLSVLTLCGPMSEEELRLHFQGKMHVQSALQRLHRKNLIRRKRVDGNILWEQGHPYDGLTPLLFIQRLFHANRNRRTRPHLPGGWNNTP
jgi:hypothetical protein